MSIAHAILGVLTEGEQHGYEIARILADRFGGEHYNTGQIHQALDQIERKGWAVGHQAVSTSRFRRPFTITPAGRDEFGAWMQRPVPLGRPLRDEMLLKLIFVGERDREGMSRLLEERRRDVLTALAEDGRRRPRERGSRRALLAGLAVDAFRFRHEAELRWVEHCLRALNPPLAAPGAEQAGAVPPALPRDGSGSM